MQFVQRDAVLGLLSNVEKQMSYINMKLLARFSFMSFCGYSCSMQTFHFLRSESSLADLHTAIHLWMLIPFFMSQKETVSLLGHSITTVFMTGQIYLQYQRNFSKGHF